MAIYRRIDLTSKKQFMDNYYMLKGNIKDFKFGRNVIGESFIDTKPELEKLIECTKTFLDSFKDCKLEDIASSLAEDNKYYSKSKIDKCLSKLEYEYYDIEVIYKNETNLLLNNNMIAN